MMEFSELFKEKRVKLGFTQEDIAGELCVDPKTVSAWECGRIIPEPSKWDGICRCLDLTVNELFSSAFDDDKYVTIPHFIPEEEYRKQWEQCAFSVGSKGIESMVRSHKENPEAPEGMCWDYCLLLTRQELEACLFYMHTLSEPNIFTVYEFFVEPAICHSKEDGMLSLT